MGSFEELKELFVPAFCKGQAAFTSTEIRPCESSQQPPACCKEVESTKCKIPKEFEVLCRLPDLYEGPNFFFVLGIFLGVFIFLSVYELFY